MNSIGFWLDVAAQVVFWSTVVSTILAIVNKWASKWFGSYAKSKTAKVLLAIEDLCDEIGNLFKSRFAKKDWDGEDRRGGDASGASAGK